jgi:pyrrolysine biosynthesis protein PylD
VESWATTVSGVITKREETPVTRLTTSDLAGLGEGLQRYDQGLRRKTGRSLRQIACCAAGIREETIDRVAPKTRVGMISITAGKGRLPGFAEAVRDIVRHLGFPVLVSAWTDVAGLATAVEQGVEVVFMADDLRFVAISLSSRRVVDNAEATGRGYGAALEGLAGGVRDRCVLVIGAGQVGTGTARILREMGAEIGIYDLETERTQRLAREVGGTAERDLDQALGRYAILVDASPASGIIEVRHIKPETLIAAPGVPLGLTAEARALLGDRLIHDPLQIGVATMIIAAVKP